MKDIQFRGKTPDGEWKFVSYVYDEHLYKHYIVRADPDFGGWLQYEVLAGSVGQYVRLKDKNGQPIYSGDAIVIHMINDVSTYRVHWDKKVPGFAPFTFVEKDAYVASQDVEVVGNTTDNPELLK